MSAPSGNAASPSPCACTNISLMQLFHELKQKFPGVPDHVVSNTIDLYCHDKQACETHLHSEVKASLTHAYHASSSAAARQLNELKVNAPIKCRNQPITKHEVVKSSAVKSVTCLGPQKAIVSSNLTAEDNENKKVNTDANQNVVELNHEKESNKNASPITIINIDNCYAKYSAESPSDPELTNDNTKEVNRNFEKEESSNRRGNDTDNNQPESTNYKILKSNKIKCNLNERLEKGKEKKTIKKEIQTSKPIEEKPKRPNTLDFIKPNPDFAFKETLKEVDPEPCRSVSPATSTQKEAQAKEKPGTYRRECGYPLNLSVNVNCHMDLSRSYADPWMESYDSPRAITSVNLTVCTPTSNMASPVREMRDDDGFEGHVTVTVSPSTARAPRRRAPPPPPPQQPPTRLESPRPTRVAPDPPVGSNHVNIDHSLIERQKERLSRLATALAQEKSRIAQLNRETQILAAPPPSPTATQRLKKYVERLRDECNNLSKRLEMANNEPDDSDSFYRNIYTGQRPSAMWQCHMCTFRNHELLTKCEECEMPRILVGTSPSRNHDSGFGSFRDRNRRGVDRGTSLETTNVNEHPQIDSGFPSVPQSLRSQSLSHIP